VKDPSDYVSQYPSPKARAQFQTQILDAAIPWDEWYIQRILSKHDASAKNDADEGSFVDVCERVSTFLATFPNPADRTRRAHKIAERLVEFIAAESNDGEGEKSSSSSSSSLGMLRVQLESDILNMSSRKAGVREAMERRIEQTEVGGGGAGRTTAASHTSKMEKLSRGGDVLDGEEEDERKMSRKALLARRRRREEEESGVDDGGVVSDDHRLPASPRAGTTRPVAARTRPMGAYDGTVPKPRRGWRKVPERQLVPHFDGFTFKHQSDRDWLGLSGKRRSKMHLGEPNSSPEEKDRLRAETPIFEDAYRPSKKNGVVYFNSNRYLGHQYLSADAIRAGYQLGENEDGPSSDESIAEFMDRAIFESDPNQLILQAESRLLYALAKFPQARAAMRTVYSTSTFGPSNMRWTSEEREWLFLCLTGSPEIEPSLPVDMLDGGTPTQLRLQLSDRQDCPENAFGKGVSESATNHDASSDDFIETPIEPSDRAEYETNASGEEDSIEDSSENTEVEVIDSEEERLESGDDPTNNDRSIGLLDEYFLETDMFPSFSNNKIARETRAELTVQETVATLLRATAMKRFSIAKSKLTKIVSEMDLRDGDGDGDENESAINDDFTDVSSEELQELFQTVGQEVVEAQKSLYEAERSTDRVNSHLLDYSVSNGVQFRQSQAELERLDKMMEEHIASLPEDVHRPETEGSDGLYVFGADEFDEKIDPAFGGRNPDQYVVRGLPNGESKFE